MTDDHAMVVAFVLPRRRPALRAAKPGNPFASPPQPSQAAAQPTQPVRADVKVGRNDPCPYGSGKKFKHCHGREVGAVSST